MENTEVQGQGVGDRETGYWQRVAGGRNTHRLGNGDSEAEARDALLQMLLRRWSRARVRAVVLGDRACVRGPSLMGSVALVEVMWPPSASASSSEKWG